jgi:rare lipoprotein A
VTVAVIATLSGCAHHRPEPVTAAEARPGAVEKGDASWYGHPYHGRQTASGEVYDMHRLTAAHRTLPFGTMVRVTRRDDHRWVEVRINDRGPFIRGRIIDLSYEAARRIGLDLDGVAPVRVEVLDRTHPAEPEAVPSPSIQDAAGEACWWVQVGAFSSAANARGAEIRLEAAGEPAVVVEGPGGIERVRVGPFDAERAAENALKRIRRDWPEAQLVPCG